MNLDWDKFFTMAIFGCQNSGKTNLVRSIIYHGSKKGGFDHCLLFSATHKSEDYDFLDDKYKYEAFDREAIERYVNFCKRNNEKTITSKGLLVMDDICGDLTFRGDFMKSLYSNHRHYGLSIIVSQQIIIELPPHIRSLNKYGCIFKYINESDREKIYNTFGSLCDSKAKFLELYDKYTDEEYKFMFFSKTNMFNKEKAYCGIRAKLLKTKFKLNF